MRTIAGLSVLLILTASARADDIYARAVKSLTMSVSPATAAPGATVKVTITVDLADGFHTYPTVQPDPKAADQITKIVFPAADAGGLIFVGSVKNPANPVKKAEPLLGIRELHELPGLVTFEHMAVVSPKIPAGKKSIALTEFKLMVCNDRNCFPAKAYSVSGTLTVSGEPVPVEPAYRAEVEKALSAKK